MEKELQIIRLPRKYGDIIQILSLEDKGRLLDSILYYQKKDIKLEGTCEILFNLIKVDLDNLHKKANSGKLGGRPPNKPKVMETTKPKVMETENLKKGKEEKRKEKKGKESNIVIANKFATLEEYIKTSFSSEFISDIYNKYKLNKIDFQEECESFLMYRQEKSPNGIKQRWEKEKTFDPKLRFRNWMKNNKKFNTNNNKKGVTTINW